MGLHSLHRLSIILSTVLLLAVIIVWAIVTARGF